MTHDSQSKLVIIGNGPSLRNFDLTNLRGVDALGMNAAYRHWDRIGWYPNIYCCLDDELINTHWKEIRRLVEKRLVREAFLSGHFLNLMPEASHDNRYRFLDNFVESWHQRRGQRFELEFIHHPAFTSSNPRKLTTGSYAVRYGIISGYKRIALMGIDLKYVEQIPEARWVDGIRLQMTETPKNNPNYFFDDYQRAGDTFQVPNPDMHDGNLHLASFEVLRNDLVTLELNVDIVNTSLNSALHGNAVLPYQSIDTFLGRSLLAAVVVPTNARERDAILNNIWLWDQPAFAPFLHMQNRQTPKLVFCFNNETARVLEPEILDAFDKTRQLKKCFSGVEFRYLSLYGDDDAYVKDGSKAGPNNQFFEAMRAAADLGKYIFYMETDCVPIRVDWLGQLQDMVQHSEPFWILGSIYRGRCVIERSISRHINGNAVYAVGDSDFQNFVTAVWQPALQEMTSRDVQCAYDMVIEAIFAGARSSDPNDRVWHFVQSAAHKLRYTDFIRNFSGRMGSQPCEPDIVRTVLEESPTTHLLHGHVFVAAVSKLRENDGHPITPSSLQLATPRRNGVTGPGAESSADTLEVGVSIDVQVDNESIQPAGTRAATASSPAKEFATRYSEAREEYMRLVRAIRDFVAINVPDDATLAVVSKGDNELVRMGDRRVWHFPPAEAGGYAGCYPANDIEARDQLERIRSMGAEYLVLPRTALWWLKHYEEFASYLFANCRVLVSPDTAAVVFNLKDGKVEPADQVMARRAIEDGFLADVVTTQPYRANIERHLNRVASQAEL